MAEAFEQLLETVDPKRLPAHGGVATTVVVTISLEALRAEAGFGDLPDGTMISAGEVRRLACGSNIIPAVLGGKSEVLDLGRTRRLFSESQRRVLGLMHQTCQAEGCTVPAIWTDVHHDQPWSQGGKTDIKEARLYCKHHHRCVHDPAYEVNALPNGDYRIRRRR